MSKRFRHDDSDDDEEIKIDVTTEVEHEYEEDPELEGGLLVLLPGQVEIMEAAARRKEARKKERAARGNDGNKRKAFVERPVPKVSEFKREEIVVGGAKGNKMKVLNYPSKLKKDPPKTTTSTSVKTESQTSKPKPAPQRPVRTGGRVAPVLRGRGRERGRARGRSPGRGRGRGRAPPNVNRRAKPSTLPSGKSKPVLPGAGGRNKPPIRTASNNEDVVEPPKRTTSVNQRPPRARGRRSRGRLMRARGRGRPMRGRGGHDRTVTFTAPRRQIGIAVLPMPKMVKLKRVEPEPVANDEIESREENVPPKQKPRPKTVKKDEDEESSLSWDEDDDTPTTPQTDNTAAVKMPGLMGEMSVSEPRLLKKLKLTKPQAELFTKEKPETCMHVKDKRKKWKQRFIRIITEKSKKMVQIFKTDDVKNVKNRPVLNEDLKKCIIRKDVPSRGRNFVLAILSPPPSSVIHYVSVKDEKSLNMWLEVLDIHTGRRNVEATKINNSQLSEIYIEMEKIIGKYNRTRKLDKAIKDARIVHEKFPGSLKITLLLADFLQKKASVDSKRMAVEYLIPKVEHCLYPRKLSILSPEEKKQQFRFQIDLARCYKGIYESKKKTDYLKLALNYCSNCQLMCDGIESSQISLQELQGRIYDLLREWEKASITWQSLLAMRPTKQIFYRKYVETFKMRKLRDELREYLLSLDKSNCRIPLVYKELTSLVKRKERKAFQKKFEFYSWVPVNIAKRILYSDELYDLMTKVTGSLSKSKCNIVREKILRFTNVNTTELIITLCDNFEKDFGQNPPKHLLPFFNQVADELQNSERYDMNLLESAIDLFCLCDNPLIANRVFPMIARHENDVLKKKDLHDEFIEHCKKLLFIEKREYTLIDNMDLLEKGGESCSRLFPVLKLSLENCKDYAVKNVCLLGLSFCENDKTREEIIKILVAWARKKEFTLYATTALYSIKKDKAILQSLARTKKIYEDLYEFLRKQPGTEIYVKGFAGKVKKVF